MENEELYGMDGNFIMKKAKESRHLTQVQLAEKMGLKQSALSGQMNRGRVSLDAFVNILNAMDYDVVIVDRTSGDAKWKVDNEL